MKFSVLVPSFKRPGLLRRNLEALALQSRKPDEILIAIRPIEDPDGNSTVKDFTSAHPELLVKKIEMDIAGVLPAENALLKECTGDVACFIDDDAIPRPFWLEKLSHHYLEAKVGGVAGPAYDVVNGKPRQLRARFRNRVMFPGIILDQSTRHTDRSIRVDHFRGANMSFRTEALRACGGFDERLLGDAYRFEMDACLAISRLGYRLIFEPAAEVDHHEAPRNTAEQRQQANTIRSNAANETYVLLKHWGLGIKGGLHLLFAILVGNFSCPGIAWAIIGQILKPITRNRHLLGVRYLSSSIGGRMEGWKMATAKKRA